ncbi:MAG: copper resistance protein CopC, partial [Alicyclobacillaceae bacterium]|nr:copper resistance protein CopC [Alicyclobacillaceae bacterium]
MAALVWALLAALLVATPLASAHAYIVKSDPAPNQRLSDPPREVRIWFDEPVQLVMGSLQVRDESGRLVNQGAARTDAHDPKLVECALRRNLPPGLYSIRWRVISADGHPVQGVIPFSVGVAGAQTGGAQKTSQPYTAGYRPGPGMLLTRWLQYLSAMVYTGALWFGRYVLAASLRSSDGVNRRLNRLLWTAWAGLTAGTLLSLPVQASVDTGTSGTAAMRWPVIRTVVGHTASGAVWMTEMAILLCLFAEQCVLVRAQRRRLRDAAWAAKWFWPAAALAWGWLLAKSFNSHAAAGSGAGIAVPMDVIHLTAGSIWVGSLAGMVCVARARRDEPAVAAGFAETLRRFGPWGMSSVFALVVTGYYAATANIPTRYAWTHTLYGRTLLVKLAVFAGMFALAAYHWVSVRRRRSRLRRLRLGVTVAAEWLLGAAVLGITSVLTNLPTAMSAPGPVDQTLATSGVQATLLVTPNAVGTNRFQVTLR